MRKMWNQMTYTIQLWSSRADGQTPTSRTTWAREAAGGRSSCQFHIISSPSAPPIGLLRMETRLIPVNCANRRIKSRSEEISWSRLGTTSKHSCSSCGINFAPESVSYEEYSQKVILDTFLDISVAEMSWQLVACKSSCCVQFDDSYCIEHFLHQKTSSWFPVGIHFSINSTSLSVWVCYTGVQEGD